MAMKLTKTELEALRKSSASGESRNAMSKSQLDSYRKNRSKDWTPIEYYQTYDLQTTDGNSFGKVSYGAYKAIESGTLDSYKPKTEDEQKSLDNFKKNTGYGRTPFTVKSQYDNDKYGKGNIDLSNRPIYTNPDGKISTVDSITVGIDDKQVVLPTIVRDKNGNAKRLETTDEAVEHYYNTGEYLGKFDTQEEADEYAQSLHIDQDLYYSFVLNSQYKPTTNGKEAHMIPGSFYYDETGFDDIEHDYINGNQDAIGIVNVNETGPSTYKLILGEDSQYLRTIKPEELSLYNYIYNVYGKDEGKKFLKDISGDLNQRSREAYEKRMSELAKKDPVFSSLATVVLAPAKVISTTGIVKDYMYNGEIDQNSGYMKYSYGPKAVRSTVSDSIKNSWAGDVGEFVYNAGMSIGDSLMNTAASGGQKYISLGLMGAGAFADTVLDAKDRGLSDEQAIQLGTIASAAEIFTENFSYDKLFGAKNIGKTTGKNAVTGVRKYIVDNIKTNAFEEMGADGINFAADVLVAKDKSQWQESINAYKKEGKSDSEAWALSFRDTAVQIGMSGLAGALSGGVMSGTSSLFVHSQISKIGSANSDSIIDIVADGLSQPKDSDAYKNAYKLAYKKSVSDYDLGRQVLLNDVQHKIKDASNISVGDKFEDTKTERTITVVSQDGTKTTVEIETPNGVKTKTIGNNRIANLVASGQMVKLESGTVKVTDNDTDTVTATTEETSATETTESASTDMSETETPKYTVYDDEDVSGTVSIGETYIDNESKNRIKVIARNESTTALEITYPNGEKETVTKMNASADRLAISDKYTRVDDSAETVAPKAENPSVKVGDVYVNNQTGETYTVAERDAETTTLYVKTKDGITTQKIDNVLADDSFSDGDTFTKAETAASTEVDTSDAEVTGIVDAINETIEQGALDEIFDVMKRSESVERVDVITFAKSLRKSYKDHGTIGGIAEYFTDNGKKVISAIESTLGVTDEDVISKTETTTVEDTKKAPKNPKKNKSTESAESTETVSKTETVAETKRDYRLFDEDNNIITTFVSTPSKAESDAAQLIRDVNLANQYAGLKTHTIVRAEATYMPSEESHSFTINAEETKTDKPKSKRKSVTEASSTTDRIIESYDNDGIVTELMRGFGNHFDERFEVYQDGTLMFATHNEELAKEKFKEISKRVPKEYKKVNGKYKKFNTEGNGGLADVWIDENDTKAESKSKGKKAVAKSATTKKTDEKTESLFIDDRTWDDVSSRKVKAFQFENPEVKPFYKTIAQELLSDLQDTVKGERIKTGTYEMGNEKWTGTSRFTSNAIARIKDTTGATYDKIKDAVQRIINDEGQENIALAKKIELVIDDMLSDGYTSFRGEKIPPNQDYLDLKEYLSGDEQNTDRYSLSSMGASFFDNEKISAKEMEAMLEDGSYKEWKGYKDYVEKCVDMYQQSRGIPKMSKKLQESLIEKPLYGIMRVAVASAKAGYNIIDNGKQRSTRDSQNRLLFSSLEPNSDYVTSSDISTICDKRTNFSEIYDEIVRLEEERGVPADKRFFKNIDNYFILHKIMADKGLTIPCEECYVESMRKNLGKMADSFIKLIKENDENNKSNDQLYHQKGKDKGKLKTNNATKRTEVRRLLAENDVLSIDDITVEMLTTAKGLTTLRLQAPDVYEQFNAFYGQAKPKLTREATPFRFGELTALLTKDDGTIDTALVKEIVSTGGFRLQSYSDFQIKNYVDVLQTLFEASMLGLNGHAYTKVPAFLEATNGTNLKRNISIFMYEDGGTWNLDKKNSFPMELEDIYALVASDESGNTSIIAVSQNADMSAWVMANDLVGYGIPFHKSGLKMEVVRGRVVKTPDGREILGYANEIDHTKQQSEVYKKTVSAKEKANTKAKKPIDIYSLWDFEGDTKRYQQLKKAHDEGKIDDSQYQKSIETMRKKLIEKNIKAYIDECDNRNYRPKFRAYVMNNGKLLNKILEYSKEFGYVSQDATVDDISFKYGEYTIPYGYYKFLGDFGMFKPDGTASPIEPLSLENYDFDKAVDFFKDSAKLRLNELLQQFENGEVRTKYRKMVEKSELTVEQLENIAKEKRSEVAQDVLEGRYSLAEEDAEYLELAKNPEKNEARLREMVDEVAKANGYRVAGHHGTDNRFTVFDRSKTNDANDFGQGFYFTSSEVEAQKYQNDDAFGDTYNKIYNVAYDKALEKIEESGEDANDDSIFTPIFNDEFDKELKRRSDEGAVINAYLKMDNPFVVSTSNWITKDEAIDIAKNTMYAENFPDESVISDWIHSIESYAKQHDGKVDTHQFANNMGHAISLTKALLHQGKYDGILDYSVGKKFNTTADYHAIALYPSKIKDSSLVTYDDDGNVIPLSQRFNKDNEDIRYSVADYAPTFYSQMGKVIDGMKQNKMGAKDVLNYLKDPKRGVKQEEIKWSGIEEFLESKKSVTKAELQEFVAGSMLQIEEITLDGRKVPYTQEQTEQIAEYEAERNGIFEELKTEWKKAIGTEFPNQTNPNGLESQVVDVLGVTDRQRRESTYAGKELVEARKQLRELLEQDDFGYDSANEAYYYATRNPQDFLDNYDLTDDEKAIFERFISAKELFEYEEIYGEDGIPTETQRHLKDIAKRADDISRKIRRIESERNKASSLYDTKWSEYKIKGGKNYREVIFKMPDATYSNDAMYAHWSDTVTNARGILAHARVQDLEVDGKKMLFIEEIQSDWHNEGHKKGYADIDKAKKLNERSYELRKKNRTVRESLTQEIANHIEGKVDNPINAAKSLLLNLGAYGTGSIRNFLIKKYNLPSDLISKIREYDASVQEMASLGIEAYKMEQGIEDAPFKDNYHEYVLKNLIRMAAEQGYDSIGWTPADVQSGRWSDEYAEGYRIEYDQDIPKFLNKYGKKWGTKVGRTPMEIDGVSEIEYFVDDHGNRNWGWSKLFDDILTRNGISDEQNSDYIAYWVNDTTIKLKNEKDGSYLDEEIHFVSEPASVWSMPITDSMRDSVLYEGQTLYSLEKEGKNNEQIRSDSLLENSRRGHNGDTRKQVERISDFKQKNQGRDETERKSFAKELLKQGQTEEVIEKTEKQTYKYALVKPEAYNDDMKSMVEEAKSKGVELGFFVGTGRVGFDTYGEFEIDGIKFSDTRILVQYDAADLPQLLAKHELGHALWNTPEMQKAKEEILGGLTEDDKKKILSQQRYKRYKAVYKGKMDIVWEEFVVDVLSGKNEYTETFIETVNDYWYGNESAEGYNPSTYAESIDAGGKQINAQDAEYLKAVESGDMETAQRIINERAEMLRAEVFAETDCPAFTIRRKPAPKKTIKVYKVFTLDSKGKPSALFVAGNHQLPVGVWLDAVDSWHFTAKNGLEYVPSTQNPNTEGGKTGASVTIHSEELRNELIKRGFLPQGSTAKSITALAYRPGWHAGDMPFFPQGGFKISGSNYPNVHRHNQVVFECELSANEDWTTTKWVDEKVNGKKTGNKVLKYYDFQTMPVDSFYEFATNPLTNAESLGKWYIGGSLKINRALSESEVNDILLENGFLPQEWGTLEGEKTEGKHRNLQDHIAPLDLDALGYDATQTDGGKKLLDAVTYDDNGNIIPPSERFNPEINDPRYSLEGDDIPDFLKLWNEHIDKYGAIPKGEKPARDIDVPKKISKKDVVSLHARTILEAGVTPDWAVSEFEKAIVNGEMTHEVIHNKDVHQKAIDVIKTLGFKEALNDWDNKVKTNREVTEVDYAMGVELYRQCVANKDVKNAMKLAVELAVEESHTGRKLQLARLMKTLTPDGQLYFLEKSIQKMNEEFKAQLGDKFKDIELDESLAEEFFNAENEETRDEAYDRICQHIADQIPATKRDKWDSWRFLAMLGNPRTHMRNFTGNLAFIPAVRLKNYVAATIEYGLEKGGKMDASERTKSLKKSEEARNFAKEDADKKEVEKMLQGENAKYATTSDIEGKRTIFKTKWLEYARRKNFDWLEAADMKFLKFHYTDALARLISVRNLDVNSIDAKTLDKIRRIAVNEAQKATYRDANALAEALSGVIKKAKKHNSKAIRGAGIILEGISPFIKTPMNIAKQGVYYSPAGVVVGVYNAYQKRKGADITVAEVVDDFAKGLTGTGMMLLGYILTSLGVLRGGDDEDKKKKNFDELVGEQSYALKFGEYSYTIDWMVPSSIPLFVGHELHKLLQDGFKLADVLNATSGLTEPLLELSVFSGYSKAIEAANYSDTDPISSVLLNAMSSYITQALPTIGGQVSRLIDPQKREYYYMDKTSGMPILFQRLIGQTSSKIPFVSYLYTPSVDEWGRDEEYGGLDERIIENLVSPGYLSKENYTEVDKELKRLYEATGDNAVLPVTQTKYFKIDNVTNYLSAQDYAEVKRMRGQKSFELISELMSNKKKFKVQNKQTKNYRYKSYSQMTDEEKVTKIKDCFDDAGTYAKEQMIKKKKNKSE
jgi:hypothetical protein